jgi:exportin-1
MNAFVNLMFEHSSDPVKFKFTLRDFLISLKEFSDADDNAELFIDEKEAAAETKRQEERQAAIRVPGMIKPALLDDDAEL